MTKKKRKPYQNYFTGGEADDLAISLIQYVERFYKSGDTFLLNEWCFENKISPRSLSQMDTVSSDFQQAHFLAKELQAHSITKGALNRNLDARFSTFILSAIHKWTTNHAESPDERLREKVDQKTNLFEQYKQNPEDLAKKMKDANDRAPHE